MLGEYATNMPSIGAYFIFLTRGVELTKEELSIFDNGTTPNKYMAYFRSKGLSVEEPEFISHQTISDGLQEGKFTFITFIRNGIEEAARISFVKRYDKIKDKLIFIEDWDLPELGLDELEVLHFFTVDPYGWL